MLIRSSLLASHLHGNGWPSMTWNCCNFDKHDKLTQCCRAFTLALARLSCYTSVIRTDTVILLAYLQSQQWLVAFDSFHLLCNFKNLKVVGIIAVVFHCDVSRCGFGRVNILTLSSQKIWSCDQSADVHWRILLSPALGTRETWGLSEVELANCGRTLPSVLQWWCWTVPTRAHPVPLLTFTPIRTVCCMDHEYLCLVYLITGTALQHISFMIISPPLASSLEKNWI